MSTAYDCISDYTLWSNRWQYIAITAVYRAPDAGRPRRSRTDSDATARTARIEKRTARNRESSGGDAAAADADTDPEPDPNRQASVALTQRSTSARDFISKTLYGAPMSAATDRNDGSGSCASSVPSLSWRCAT